MLCDPKDTYDVPSYEKVLRATAWVYKLTYGSDRTAGVAVGEETSYGRQLNGFE
jgi:hypothetical protein